MGISFEKEKFISPRMRTAVHFLTRYLVQKTSGI